MKKILLIFIMPVLIISGCANQQLTVSPDSSQVVFIDGLNTLTVSALVENKSHFQSSSFLIEIEIHHEELQRALDTTGLLIGKNQKERKNNEMNGQVYKVKANENIEGGATFNIHGDTNDEELEKIINNENAIKVTLLDRKGEPFTSEFIHNFKKINDNENKNE